MRLMLRCSKLFQQSERISFETRKKKRKIISIKLWGHIRFLSMIEKFLWTNLLLQRRKRKQDRSQRTTCKRLRSILRLTLKECRYSQIFQRHFMSKLKTLFLLKLCRNERRYFSLSLKLLAECSPKKNKRIEKKQSSASIFLLLQFERLLACLMMTHNHLRRFLIWWMSQLKLKFEMDAWTVSIHLWSSFNFERWWFSIPTSSFAWQSKSSRKINQTWCILMTSSTFSQLSHQLVKVQATSLVKLSRCATSNTKESSMDLLASSINLSEMNPHLSNLENSLEKG